MIASLYHKASAGEAGESLRGSMLMLHCLAAEPKDGGRRCLRVESQFVPRASPAACAVVHQVIDREGPLRVDAPFFERQFDDGRALALRVQVYHSQNDVAGILSTLAEANHTLVIGGMETQQLVPLEGGVFAADRVHASDESA